MNEKVDAIHSKIPIYGTVMTKCNIFGSPSILVSSSISFAVKTPFLCCHRYPSMLGRL